MMTTLAMCPEKKVTKGTASDDDCGRLIISLQSRKRQKITSGKSYRLGRNSGSGGKYLESIEVYELIMCVCKKLDTN